MKSVFLKNKEKTKYQKKTGEKERYYIEIVEKSLETNVAI